MDRKQFLKTLALPIIFALLVAAYFSPFYLHTSAGGISGKIYAFVLICWLVLFLTLWLYTIVVIILALKQRTLNKYLILHCTFIWVSYIVWFGFASNGYFLAA